MWRTPVSQYSRITSSTSSRLAPTQVRCAAGFSVGLVQDALDRAVRALARRAAGAVGHRDEGRIQRGQAGDGLPQALFHRRRLGREELERDARTPAGLALAALAGAGDGTKHATREKPISKLGRVMRRSFQRNERRDGGPSRS
jgi:hypothetical protein